MTFPVHERKEIQYLVKKNEPGLGNYYWSLDYGSSCCPSDEYYEYEPSWIAVAQVNSYDGLAEAVLEWAPHPTNSSIWSY